MKRQHYRTDLTQFNGERVPCPEEEANLVSSHVSDGLHAPIVDLDFPCRLEPSTTPGHFHLYVDKAITWEQTKALLEGFHKAGLIEDGYYGMSIARGATFVRKPGVEKKASDSNSAGGAR